MIMKMSASRYQLLTANDLGFAEGPSSQVCNDHRDNLESHLSKAVGLMKHASSDPDLSPRGRFNKAQQLAVAAIEDVKQGTKRHRDALNRQLLAAQQNLPTQLPNLLSYVKSKHIELWNSMSSTGATDIQILNRTILFTELLRAETENVRELRQALRSLSPLERTAEITAAGSSNNERSFLVLVAVSGNASLTPLVEPSVLAESVNQHLQQRHPTEFSKVSEVKSALKLIDDNESASLRFLQTEAGLPTLGAQIDTIKQAANEAVSRSA